VISFSLPKPDAEPVEPLLENLEEVLPEPVAADQPMDSVAAAPEAAPEQSSAAAGSAAATAVGGGTDEAATTRGGMGIRSKMMLLFMLIPLVMIGLAGYLVQRQINELSAMITQESIGSITKMAEDIIADSGRSVAKQCRLYLTGHATMKKEDFRHDMDFRRIAVQKVGLTGFTYLYEIASGGQPMTMWVYPDERMIGMPLGETLKKDLGAEFAKLSEIIKAPESGKNVESSGYYVAKDRDGTAREKFMVVTPLEGTSYGIASTTFLDEFTVPAKRLERRVAQLRTQARNIGIGILLGTLVLVSLFVSIFGHRLTGRIKRLTEVADRISVGDLDAAIPAQARDEVGQLADAISRMQDSLRLSIERLRRRR
jgi:HAMP domain-containing protein